MICSFFDSFDLLQLPETVLPSYSRYGCLGAHQFCTVEYLEWMEVKLNSSKCAQKYTVISNKYKYTLLAHTCTVWTCLDSLQNCTKCTRISMYIYISHNISILNVNLCRIQRLYYLHQMSRGFEMEHLISAPFAA